jgi:uncharacterized membrane protein
MRNSTNKGALVAAIAAGLFSAGLPVDSRAADSDKVRCHGINACKGKGACNGADHACAGKNSCKGKGWIETTEKQCKEKGGRIEKAKPMKM